MEKSNVDNNIMLGHGLNTLYQCTYVSHVIYAYQRHDHIHITHAQLTTITIFVVVRLLTFITYCQVLKLRDYMAFEIISFGLRIQVNLKFLNSYYCVTFGNLVNFPNIYFSNTKAIERKTQKKNIHAKEQVLSYESWCINDVLRQVLVNLHKRLLSLLIASCHSYYSNPY